LSVSLYDTQILVSLEISGTSTIQRYQISYR